MALKEKLIYSGDTDHGHYEIIDMEYTGRPARVLFSGDKIAAQSGVAKDDDPDLLFDYNQRFKELVESLRPKRVLLIGGGVLTLPIALIAAFPELQIDVVELDDGLQKLAEQFFDFKPSERLRIIIDDGRHFLDTINDIYDLILIDAFTHTIIPDSLISPRAVQEFKRHVSPKGAVAINIISAYYGRNAKLIQEQYKTYSEVFRHVEIFPASRSLLSFWLPQNFVLIAHADRKIPITLRYEALDPPAP